MFLLSGINEVTAGTPRKTFGKTKGYFIAMSSGNSASATFSCSPDGVNFWSPITALNLGVNATATAQVIDMVYPFVRGSIEWISAGTNAATVTMLYVTGAI